MFDKTKEFGLQHILFPIMDQFYPTDLAQFHKLLNDMISLLKQGKTIIVHCLAGLGRTGLVCACCILMLKEEYEGLDITPNSAIQMIRTARPGTIESLHQVQYVNQFQPPSKEDFSNQQPEEKGIEKIHMETTKSI